LFLEERRRLKIIPDGLGEKPVLKLMFGALIRAAERWRGLRFTEFELVRSLPFARISTPNTSISPTEALFNRAPAGFNHRDYSAAHRRWRWRR
jgi:hypothetical protein